MGNLKRQNEILELLKEQNYVSVDYLAVKLFASPSSIRRDLTQLEHQGYVKRSYGGAALATQPAGLAPFAMRKQENRREKQKVVRQAATLIRPDTSVFFDSSTTSQYFVYLMKPEWNITAYTNNLQLAHLLASHHIRTYCVGGMLSDRDNVIATGSYALEMLKNIHVDQMFFTCTALSDTGQITDASEQETQVRKLMLGQAEERIFLCPHNRYGKWAQHFVTSLAEVECVVSERSLTKSFREQHPHVKFVEYQNDEGAAQFAERGE